MHFGGRSPAIFHLVNEGVFEIFLSLFILHETAGVLKRKFHWGSEQCNQLIQLLEEASTVVYPIVPVHIIKEDETDNRIIECAIAADAEYLLSGDQHLLKYREYEGIKILTPGEFLDQFT